MTRLIADRFAQWHAVKVLRGKLRQFVPQSGVKLHRCRGHGDSYSRRYRLLP